jgi:general secretion pathway protein M
MTYRIEQYLKRYPAASALLYATLVLGALFICATELVDLHKQFNDLAASREILRRLETRARALSGDTARAANERPAGSPFLEGPTVTVAGASLLQRTSNAIVSVAGSLLSSEVEAQSMAKDGNIRINAICELEQNAVQPLLYDLEAGMPFLFVEQLTLQGARPDNKGRMRVSLGITARWRSSK